MNIQPSHTITFLRHGESVGNAEDRFQGQADFPLTELGLAQARRLAERWLKAGRTYDQCLASPLLRARQTAEIVAGALGLPIEFDPIWMEVNNGRLAGLTSDEAAQLVPEPKVFTAYTHYGETGESPAELLLRAGKAVHALVDKPAGRYLVISHGSLLNSVLYNILAMHLGSDGKGARFMFGNTGTVDLTYEPQTHTWRMWAFENNELPAE